MNESRSKKFLVRLQGNVAEIKLFLKKNSGMGVYAVDLNNTFKVGTDCCEAQVSFKEKVSKADVRTEFTKRSPFKVMCVERPCCGIEYEAAST